MAHRFADARQSSRASPAAWCAGRDRRSPATGHRPGLRHATRCGVGGAPPDRRTKRASWRTRCRSVRCSPTSGSSTKPTRVSRRRCSEYRDVSPFAMAWVCFQLGVLWGELVPERQSARAARWYRQAVAYLPSYVKARVHLAEIYLDDGRPGDAEGVTAYRRLRAATPKSPWRLADVMTAMGSSDGRGAAASGRAARLRSTSGKAPAGVCRSCGRVLFAAAATMPARAFELARINVANRPTLRAFEQAYATAVDAGESAGRVGNSRCCRSALGNYRRVPAIIAGVALAGWSRHMKISRRNFIQGTGTSRPSIRRREPRLPIAAHAHTCGSGGGPVPITTAGRWSGHEFVSCSGSTGGIATKRLQSIDR